MTNIFKYTDLINDRVPVKSTIGGHLGDMSRITCICFDSLKKIVFQIKDLIPRFEFQID